MDVRCEKCQTEYELDEARLKPGGVTVKCTNCGHMFKIRKRTPTNVGAPPAERQRPTSSKPPIGGRADSILGDIPRAASDSGSGPTAERQWLIRLESGEQRSCRELAVLQQWIIAGIVTRESLISRTGKTWKRLGDVTDLGQYFVIADEARQTREERTTHQVPRPAPPIYPPKTMPGVGAVKAAGGTVLPDDEDNERTTGSFKARPLPPRASASPVPVRTPPLGSPASRPVSDEQVTVRASYTDPTVRAQVMPPGFGGPSQSTPPPAAHGAGPSGHPLAGAMPVGFGGPPQPAPPELKPAPNTAPKTGPAATAQTEMLPPAPPPTRRPTTTPPPPPARKTQLQPNQAMPAPVSNRSTAMWASDGIRPADPSDGDGPSFGGRLAAIPDEPAFMAGRVRVEPGSESAFETGKVRFPADEDDLVPGRTGSGAGKWIALVAVLVMVAGAGVIYMVIRQPGKDDTTATKPPPPRDAAVAMAADAAPVITPIPDAAAPAPDPLDVARGELLRDDDTRLKAALTSLDGKDDPPAQALRAQLASAIAQAMLDRAGLVADKTEAEKLRKDAKTIVVDAAPLAQKALKAKPDDAAANLAMADVLRLQGKPARDVKRYLDAARAKADKDTTREVTLAEALLLARDGKLDDAKTNLASLDQGDGKLEKSGDIRARYHLALVAFAQGKPTDAKPLVEQILAAQPDHPGARALAAKLETTVAKTDQMPPEDGPKDAGVSAPPRHPPDAGRRPEPPVASGGESYDRLLQQANAIADKNCAKAMELYAKALEQKPNGVEALSGMGYCHIDRKEFSSAQSKFRAALAVSPRYEPALYGIAEGYAQQGRKDDAINSFKAYLEIYPNAAKARKRLDMLGGGAAPDNGGGSAAPPPQPPPQPPQPPPQPPAGSAAPPAGAGSGSG